jgi:hypothetical protein
MTGGLLRKWGDGALTFSLVFGEFVFLLPGSELTGEVIRELYIHDWSLLSIQNMSAMSSLRSVSYPIGADHPLLAKFPNYLTILEFREVEVVTEPLLEMIAGTFKELRRLRIDCGEEGPYEPLACDDEGKTAVDLAVCFGYHGLKTTIDWNVLTDGVLNDL